MFEPAQKYVNNAIVKQNYTRELFIAFKISLYCFFSLGENLVFPESGGPMLSDQVKQFGPGIVRMIGWGDMISLPYYFQVVHLYIRQPREFSVR